MDPADTSAALFADLVDVLHAAVVLLRVGDREDAAAIQRDVHTAVTLLQRCVMQVARRTDAAAEPAGPPRRKTLSPRERLIVGALAQDQSYKDIAHRLDMSLSSVQARVKSIYAKLGVHSKAELKSLMAPEAASPAQDG